MACNPFRGVCFAAAVFLGACAADMPAEEAEHRFLEFLKVGQTTREDVLVALGTPNGVFENERILTYRLRAEEGALVPGRDLAQFGLTVVFDDAGRLARYKLRKY